jgi:hypothetical protein
MSTVTFHDLVQKHRQEVAQRYEAEEALRHEREAFGPQIIQEKAESMGLMLVDGKQERIHDQSGIFQSYGRLVRPSHWLFGGFWMFVNLRDNNSVFFSKSSEGYTPIALSNTAKVAEFFAKQEQKHNEEIVEKRLRAAQYADQLAHSHGIGTQEAEGELGWLVRNFPEREQEWQVAYAAWSARQLHLQQVAEQYAQALLAHRRQDAYITGVNEAILANIQQELAVAVPYYEVHFAYVGINEEGDPGLITDTAVVLDAAPDANGWWRECKRGVIFRVLFQNIAKIVEKGYATADNPAGVLARTEGIYTDPRKPEQAEWVRQQLALALLPSPPMLSAPPELANEYELRMGAVRESDRLFNEEMGLA